jgi:3-oxoadipate enol-lactonase
MAVLDAKHVTLHRMGSGASLVLLRCLGVDHRFWDFAAPLAEKFILLRYDLPGHGAMPVPDHSYAISDLSMQLAAILHANSIGRASIAGISLGGLIAQHFAAHNPESVERVAFIDTTPRYSNEIRDMWCVRAKTARTAGVAAMVPDLLKIWFSDACLARDPASMRYVRETLQQTAGEGYALACGALDAADLPADAAKIQAPTLVVCGENDIPSFLDSARWLTANIKGAKLAWIPQARHASVIECPGQAVKLLGDFLD